VILKRWRRHARSCLSENSVTGFWSRGASSGLVCLSVAVLSVRRWQWCPVMLLTCHASAG
jgi:hypothetical protein